jgi:hypothetical protein
VAPGFGAEHGVALWLLCAQAGSSRKSFIFNLVVTNMLLFLVADA